MKLYRYFNLRQNANAIHYTQWLSDIFSKNIMKFTDFKRLNDPFDGKILVDYQKGTDDDFIKFICQYGELPNDISANKISSYRKHISKTLQLSKVPHIYILCFSERKDDLLMWSHYSDSHRGIVLGFDIPNNIDCYKVVYSNNFSSPRDLIQTQNNKAINKWLLKKSRHWLYEREWRMLSLNEYESSPYYLPVEIIFGCQIDKDHQDEIKALINSSSISINQSRAEINNQAYKLDFIKE